METLDFSKEELLKILAIITLSDGHLYKHKGTPRTVRLLTSNSGKAQHSFFREVCQQLFGKKTVTRKLVKNERQYILSDLNYRKGVNRLFLLSPRFKTTPGSQSTQEYLNSEQPTLSFLFNCSNKLKWFCLRTYFDFDGSISPSIKLKSKVDRKAGKTYKYFQIQVEIEIKISETNPHLVKDFILLCEQLQLKARITKDKRNWSGISGICISERKSVTQFLKQGGPVTDVLISSKSSNFYNVSKKELSYRLLKLLKDKSFSFSKSFRSKQKAEEYRKSIRKMIYS